VRQEHAATAAAASPTPSPYQRTWFDRLERQTWGLDALLRHLGRSQPAGSQIEAFADEHVALIERHLDATIFACVRQLDHRAALYALTHALHTAGVVLLTTRHLGWERDQERRAVLAALTMNVSIVELQAQMAEQHDPPNKKQMDLIRAHPHRSAQMLRDCGVSDEQWLLAVEDHHERGGGVGYPRGASEMGEIARVVRAADVYAAKVSPRALRPALLPQQAAAQLFKEEQGGPVAAALIKALGVYPPGDFVRLKNGETAIVAHRATMASATVTVALLGVNGKLIPGAPRRDAAQAEFAIAGPVIDRAHLPRVLPEQIYGVLQA
jgi:HD-GYP domain-containing protein (c-di-GMP phosphodiesterase class II)